jgi:uncharacterized damage-inducible protein DinB
LPARGAAESAGCNPDAARCTSIARQSWPRHDGLSILVEVQMPNVRTTSLSALLFAAALITPGLASAQEKAQDKMTPPAPKTYTFSGETQRGYQSLQANLADAAEKMPEENYSFKPTPEVKPFGQHIAHIALSQYSMCSKLKGEANPKKDEKEETTRSKADTIALLKGSTAYCEPLVTSITETSLGELMPFGQDKVAKGLVPLALISHADEVYGTMAVYLRLKGIVPPSTEKMNKMKQDKEKEQTAQDQSKKSSQER